MDLIGAAIVIVVVGAFVALLTWLRSGSGQLHTPGEAGDADKFSRLDSG